MVSHGILLPTRGSVLNHTDPEDLTDRTQSDVIDLARAVEDGGLDSVWLGDSVLAKPRHEPMTTLASLASATDDLVLGTAVYLPTLRHPVHVAHQAATISHTGECQLALGVGVGRGPAVEREYANLGLDYDDRGKLLDEALDIITRLWAGETVSYDGEFYQLDEADLGFRPNPEPGLYIPYKSPHPEKGFPLRIRERITDHGDGWLPIQIESELYDAGIDHARSSLAAADRDPDEFDAAYYQNVVIADTEAEAIDEARDFLHAYYPRLDSLTDDEVRTHGAFGPPEAIAAHIDEYVDAGVETFVTRFTTTGDQQAQLERFVDDVL